MVVDRDIDELPPWRSCVLTLVALTGSIARYAMSGPIETAWFFAIDVDNFTGCFSFVARPRLFRLQTSEQAQAPGFKDTADS